MNILLKCFFVLFISITFRRQVNSSKNIKEPLLLHEFDMEQDMEQERQEISFYPNPKPMINIRKDRGIKSCIKARKIRALFVVGSGALVGGSLSIFSLPWVAVIGGGLVGSTAAMSFIGLKEFIKKKTKRKHDECQTYLDIADWFGEDCAIEYLLNFGSSSTKELLGVNEEEAQEVVDSEGSVFPYRQ